VTSGRPATSEILPLRDTDPHEVGGYRLLGRLGEGGQGVVFLAAGPTGSRVAVKLLPSTTDPQVRSRFLKEFAAAQRVGRSCTAQVLDAGFFERRPFIVSEYVDGDSLVEVVEQDGPRVGPALERIAVATLTALGAVHAVGMVHRDFKPGNVLLGPNGPVVIDFGLAAVPGMTTTGPSGQVALGTPAFMAPEALAGNRVTAAADMWSWAVTIAFAGTGELPFRGESLTAVAFAILHSEPTVSGLPEPLGSLVYSCLNKDPAERPSARDVLLELVAAGARLVGPMPPIAAAPAVDQATPNSPLAYAGTTGPPRRQGEGLLSGPTSPPRSARHGNSRSRRRRRRAAVILAVVVLVAGIGALAFNLPRHGAPPVGLTGESGINQEITAENAARAQAVAWIVDQASRADIVACDPLVCQALVKKGFPAANVTPVGSGSNDPLGSALVVATAAIEAQYGGRLASVYAPIVLASFGTGSARINIRWQYPGGAANYQSVQQGDLADRKTAEAQLLTNSHITVSPSARAELLRGDIDPRLPQLLAIMADIHPVDIVAFVDQSPGGGPASLVRAVDLATVDSKAHMTPAAYLAWIKGFIRTQRSQYLPVWAQQPSPGTGQAVLQIAYGAPSPLS
jgi:serine/threonine protein kinase